MKFLSGGTPNKSEDRYWGGNIPWISSAEMSEERIHKTTHSVTEDGAANGTRLVPKNTILVVVRGMSLAKECRVSLTTCESTFNQDIKALSLTSSVDPIFVFYYLRSQKFALRDAASEAAHGTKKLDMPVLEQWPFPDIPLSTQQKIAAILTAYDDLIETNKRCITLLEQMAEELYREWFVRMRFPGHQNTKFVKGVPEGWGETTLGKIARFTMGQSPKSEFYNETGDGLSFHQGVGTYGHRFPNTVTYCSVDGRRAAKGDILFSVRAPVGRLNIADCDLIIGRGLAAIRHIDGKNSYLYYLLRTVFASEDIIGNGAIFNSVGKDELSRLALYDHPGTLVQDFEDVASQIDEQIESLIRATGSLTQTRDLLLPRLISGKLSVEDLNIEFPPSMQEEAAEPEVAHA